MVKHTSLYSFLAVLLCVLVLVLGACSQEKKKALAIGDQAPDFTATAMLGEKIHLSDWKGSPVILRFWSTECKYCRADTPIFNYYFKKYKEKGLHVVYVNTSGEPLDEVKEFVANLEICFPVITEGGIAIGKQYNVKIVPQTIFISPEGKILTAILGGVGEAEFIEIFGGYLK